MRTTMIPGCCGLKTVHEIRCISETSEFSKKQTEMFDDMVKVGTAQEGQWNTYGKALDTIAIITDSKRYNPTPDMFPRQKKFFEDKGWKLLCTWKSHESGGKNYMYGSPEMTPEKV